MFAHLALVLIAGRLAAGAAGRLVPARRGAAGMTLRSMRGRLIWQRWRSAAASPPARRRCSACGASRPRSTWRCSTTRVRGAQPRLPGRQLSVGRRAPSAGDPSGAGGARSVSACDPIGLPDDASLARPRLRRSATALSRSCRSKARACTRSRSGRCMPASSSRAISASPPMARPWCGWSSVWATCTRASTTCCTAPRWQQAARLAGRTSGDSTVAYALAFARAVESGARHRAAAARRLAARRDGGAGADRQPPRRLRRDLQRCVVQHHAGALRHAARTRAALRRRLLRPSADDGLHRARRRRGRSCASDDADPRADRRRFARASRRWWSSTTRPRRCRTARSAPASCRPNWRAGSAPAAMSAAHRAATSTHAARSAIRRTTGCSSMCRCCSEGDVNARVWIRIKEIEQSLSLIEQMLNDLPGGDVRVAIAPRGRREGMALAEAFRGDVLVWLRIDVGGTHRSLPPARRILVPVAAAGSRDRGQHRRRLPALQQIVQLLLFGARPVIDRLPSWPGLARPSALAASCGKDVHGGRPC